VNRCRTCAAVIIGVITAAALHGTVGVAGSPPASAGPAESGHGAGADSGSGARGTSNAIGPRRSGAGRPSPGLRVATASGRRDRRAVRAAPHPQPGTAPGRAEFDITGEGECSRWITVEPVIRPPREVGNRGLIFLPGLISIPLPATRLAGGAPDRLPAPDISAQVPLTPQADAPYAPASPAPIFPMGFAADPPVPAPRAGPRAGRSGPTAGRSRPPTAVPPVSARLGYPEYLRNADPAGVAAIALPGLAALLGLTATGAVFGYRQARAGYLLRAAGAGRFLP